MGLPIMSTSSPIQLSLADGKVVDTLNEAVEIQVKHGSHLSPVVCFVADVGDFDLILGMTWLEDHDPGLTFSPRSMKFSSSHCTSCCLDHGLPETVYGDGKTPSLSESRQTTPVGEICIITAKAAYLMAAHNPDEAIWVEPQDWEKLADPPDDNNDCDLDSFKRNIARLAAVTQEDYDHYMNKMESPHMTEAEIRKLVPDWLYSKMPDLFSPIQAGKLAPHREGVDHEIDTDGRIHKPKIYGLTRTETRAIKAYIDDMLGRGFIRPSTSPYASPVLVVKKPGGGLRICVDYRQLNAITKKNRNAPPSIKETLARMAKVRWMTIVDVVAAFNTVRIKEGDEEKTAFLTRYGLYEYVVMPFGLCNAPGTFQTFINETLREYLDDICTAYLDDVLIYTCDDDESVHEADVIKVLSKIRDAGLHLDPTKCKFKVKKVKYLGLILTTEGIEMDPKKVSTILDWQIPRSVKDVQSFLGFANFYRRFIKGFSYIAKALTELTRKDGEGKDQRHQFPLIADSKAIQAFHRLKDAFKTAGVLAHFDPDLETWLETDASDFVTAAILSQKDATGVLRPVAFLSHKMNPAECNYEIYDKELLAIVNAFEQWRFELSGTDDPIMVLSDHQALQTFMTTKRLNRRQARWAEFMAEFNFIIKYRPGKQGTKPDALTRRPGDLPESPDDIRRRHQLQVVIKPDQVDPEARVCTINIAKDGGSRHAVYLANLITQRTLPDSIPAVAQMLYQLSEEDNISERYAVLAALPGIEPEGGENGVSHDLTSKRSLCAADNVTISPITTPIAATSAPAIPNETPAAINVPAPPNNELTIDALLDNIKAAYKDDKVLQAIVKAKKDGLRRLPFKLIHGEEHLRLELGDCEITDELLYVRNKVYVPAGAVRTQVIEQAHKSVCGGHSGKHELYSKLSRWYYWPRMTTDVAQYVRACLTCKRSKAYREGKHGLLHPLPIPSKYWSSISIDFITHLPPCRHNGQTFTDILVVVDRLTKKKKFIPMASMTTDALVVAFIEYIWREEGFPEEIISDRGAQFVSYFWKRLCQRLGVRPKFSTAHHPQTDGQTENANSYLKQYLRAYVNYEQDNWALFLPIAEFEANSSTSSTTGKSPFFATKGYNPRSGIEPPAPAPGAATLTAPAQQERLNADAFADRMKTLQDELRASMQWAQAKQAEYANEGRLPAPAFKVGDQVMLDTRNLRTKRPSASLDLKNRGPFTIVRAINNTAYELDLPANMKRIHNVFHPWLLHLVDDNPLTGQTQDPEVPAEFDPEVEDDTEYTVEAIEDCRINKKLKDPAARGRKGKTTQGLLQYLVRWANYPDGPDNPSWEPYMNLADSADTVTRYHLDHPNKPPMHRKFKSLTGKQDMLVMRLHALSRV